jgi:hypothetical protein
VRDGVFVLACPTCSSELSAGTQPARCACAATWVVRFGHLVRITEADASRDGPGS